MPLLRILIGRYVCCLKFRYRNVTELDFSISTTVQLNANESFRSDRRIFLHVVRYLDPIDVGLVMISFAAHDIAVPAKGIE